MTQHFQMLLIAEMEFTDGITDGNGRQLMTVSSVVGGDTGAILWEGALKISLKKGVGDKRRMETWEWEI